MKKLLAIGFSILVVLILGLMMSMSQAAPLPHQMGPTPVYDSGWMLTTSGYQTFEHDLNDSPTLWTILVAENGNGDYATGSPTKDGRSNDNYYGHIVVQVHCDDFVISWQANGIGYSTAQGKWYQRGVDYARLIVFAADTGLGGPPCRP